MMQMPYFDISSMLLSGQVPCRTNSSQLLGMGYSRKKPNGWVEDIVFGKKTWNVSPLFSVLLEIPGKANFHSWKSGKIMWLCYIPRKFQGQKMKTPGNFT